MDIITQVVRSAGITAVIRRARHGRGVHLLPGIVAMHQGTILADGTPEQIPEATRRSPPTCSAPGRG